MTAKQLLLHAIHKISDDDASVVLQRSELVFKSGVDELMWAGGVLRNRSGVAIKSSAGRITSVRLLRPDEGGEDRPEPDTRSTATEAALAGDAEQEAKANSELDISSSDSSSGVDTGSISASAPGSAPQDATNQQTSPIQVGGSDSSLRTEI